MAGVGRLQTIKNSSTWMELAGMSIFQRVAELFEHVDRIGVIDVAGSADGRIPMKTPWMSPP